MIGVQSTGAQKERYEAGEVLGVQSNSTSSSWTARAQARSKQMRRPSFAESCQVGSQTVACFAASCIRGGRDGGVVRARTLSCVSSAASSGQSAPASRDTVPHARGLLRAKAAVKVSFSVCLPYLQTAVNVGDRPLTAPVASRAHASTRSLVGMGRAIRLLSFQLVSVHRVEKRP